MIVIEGPDNVGKTTLAKKLCEVTGLQYSHMSRPVEPWNWFSDYKKILKPGHVMDRAHLGGIVYHGEVGSEDARFLRAWIEAQGGIIVVVCPRDPVVYKDRCLHSEKPEMFTEEQRMGYLAEWQAIQEWGVHTLWISEIKEQLDPYVGIIATYWKGRQDLLKEWNA